MPTKKLTTKEFISRSILKHGNKYDYSEVEYVNNATKVKIICSLHGIFLQEPSSHMRGFGCRKCGRNTVTILQSSNTSDFIKKSKVIHENKYDYSKANYINARTKVCITCPVHGDFWQKPNNHLNSKCGGCKSCKNSKISESLTFSHEKFESLANKIHDFKYDYSLANYTHGKTGLTVLCPIHGAFTITGTNHLRGRGCENCSIEKTRIGKEEFINRARKIHGDRYNYEKVDYKSRHSHVLIKCSIHGYFKQSPRDHLKGQNCKKCSSSNGEDSICKLLEDIGANFQIQYRFKDCRNKRPLPFDFALFNEDDTIKCLIEFDGPQHSIKEYYDKCFGIYGKDTFENLQKRDKIKTDYCKNNNIPLLRIDFRQHKDISKIIPEFMNSL